MTDKLWYYVDAQQQKIGPVASGVLKEAYQRGQLRPDSLVWHSELAQWQSLSDHAQTLGIVLSRFNANLLPDGREVRYANFFHRWAALMVDQWVLSISCLLLVFSIATAIYFSAGFSFEKEPDTAAALAGFSVMAYLLLYMVASACYHISFESSKKQGSWGKQYLGLMVTTEQGERLSNGTATVRWFSAALSHLSQSIGFLIAAFTQKRQALHDFLAHTLVLEREASPSASPIDRNKRSVIILVLGIVVMPILLSVIIMMPMFYFIQQQEQAKTTKHEKIAALVAPIQNAVRDQVAEDETCLSHEDPALAVLIAPLKPLSSEVLIGVSDDEENCEIYIDLDATHYVSYRYLGEGNWSCEASTDAKDFGESCQAIVY